MGLFAHILVFFSMQLALNPAHMYSPQWVALNWVRFVNFMVVISASVLFLWCASMSPLYGGSWESTSVWVRLARDFESNPKGGGQLGLHKSYDKAI